MNKMIFEFLLVEGYKTAAEKFASEAGLEANFDSDLIEKRI